MKIAVLGSTGSIGLQTLDAVRTCLPDGKIDLLTAGTNMKVLASLVDEFRPKYVVVSSEEKKNELCNLLTREVSCRSQKIETKIFSGLATAPDGTQGKKLRNCFQSGAYYFPVIFVGEDGLLEAVSACDCDVVVNALVGRVGLLPTLAAIKAGKNVALANKESLVTAGNLVMGLAKEKGVNVIPIDSEHSAIMQCLQGENPECVEKIILTASGGPFRTWNKEKIAKATFRDALKHPNWDMGKKITIDSATMMNKGLELIEAMWLFGKTADEIEVVVHPQSVIHSLVQFVDGSVSAVLGLPDMRLPILYALTAPDRVKAPFPKTDFLKIKELSFSEVEHEKFPCLGLAIYAAKKGGCLPAVLNFVNEWAVERFLQGRVGFYYISDVVGRALEAAPDMKISSVEDVGFAEEFAKNFLRGEKIA